jgi:hypothetical protein
MTFNPATAYLGDWQYHDFVENGDYKPPRTGEPRDETSGLKVKKLDMDDSGFQIIAIALGLSAEHTVLLVWMPLNSDGKTVAFNPLKDGSIRLKTLKETWTIDNLRRSRFGHWEMGVTKAAFNAGDGP